MHRLYLVDKARNLKRGIPSEEGIVTTRRGPALDSLDAHPRRGPEAAHQSSSAFVNRAQGEPSPSSYLSSCQHRGLVQWHALSIIRSLGAEARVRHLKFLTRNTWSHVI